MGFFEDSPVFKPRYVMGIIHDSYKVLVNSMTKCFMERTKGPYSDDWLNGYRSAVEDLTVLSEGVCTQKEENNERNDTEGHDKVCPAGTESRTSNGSDKAD